MRADAILSAHVAMTSNPMEREPTQVGGALAPMDQVRRQVAASLFGEVAPLPQVGRFQVAKIVGTGGMGVVYAAHDPQLGRTVALKLLQPLTSGERARERLLREAQAMAQLQHPNVVGVFETGVHGEQVYVVMEYVEDGTLGDWLRVRARSLQEVLGVMLQAGEGLAAAHAAGLVHRDFKPANILMGGGRARISDFGLARPATTAEDLERTAEDSSGMLLGVPLTRTGSLLGTPAYMAPEQLRGEPASTASDQFAFGVVLYEALCGHRPFTGQSVGALAQAIEDGQIARPGRKQSLPAPVFAVIRRALARDPAQRYPTMAALLTALRSAQQIRWRRLMVAGLGVGVAAGGLLMVMSSPGETTPNETPQVRAAFCGEGDALVGVWDGARRGEVERALGETGDMRVLAAFDEYAARWQDEHTQRCTAKLKDVQWTESCLADRREALHDLGRAIVEAPAPLRAGALAAATLLPALSDCRAANKPALLMSQGEPEARVLAWRVRLGMAGAFQPRVAARAPELYRVALSDMAVRELRRSPRLAMEMDFANAVQAMHPESEPARSWESSLLGPLTAKAESPRKREAVPWLMDVARTAAQAGHDDLAARGWVLAAELLEAQAHPDRVRATIWTGAEQALARLSSGHPLRPVLARDLGYVQLVHARHTTPAGSCSGAGANFEACAAIFAAATQFKLLADTGAETASDRELLARVHDHAGDSAAAAAIRERNGVVALDESALGYLDFRAAEVVPDPPTVQETVHCNPDATLCQIDPTLVAALERDASLVLGDARMIASVKDGVARGMKAYGLRHGSGLKQLGFKNGDLIVAIDGAAAEPATFVAALTRVLTKGGSLTIERKEVRMVRKFEVR